MSTRPILLGYVALESWAEDFSEWDGIITGPHNPKGANLAWQNPIEMIEKRAYDEAFARAEKAEAEAESHKKAWIERVDMCIALRAENERLREALTWISKDTSVAGTSVGALQDIALEALNPKEKA